MQKILFIPLLIVSCLILDGCETMGQNKNQSPICQKLRRQQHYNRRNNSVEASWNTKAQHDRLDQLLKENNC